MGPLVETPMILRGDPSLVLNVSIFCNPKYFSVVSRILNKCRMWLRAGSREDLPFAADDYKGENVGNSKGGHVSHTEGLPSYRLDAKVETKQDQQMYSDDKLYPGGILIWRSQY